MGSSGRARIDILPLYTQALSDAVGGPAAIRARMNAAFAYLNASLENSGINAHVVPLRPILVSYKEGPVENQLVGSLNWLYANAGPFRDERLADLVHLFQHGPFPSSGTYVAGRATMFNGNSGAYGGVTANIAYDLSTFAHEIGHNLSAGHSVENGCGSFPDSCGHHGWPYRDFMTYFSACSGCVEINLFSSPGRTYPNGSPAGTSAHNNARGVGLASPIVEQFRVYTGPPLVNVDPATLLSMINRPRNDVVFRDGFDTP